MEIRSVAAALGIEGYPEGLETCGKEKGISLPALVNRLQERYDLFGSYYDTVMTAAKQIAQDPVRLSWCQTVWAYLQDATLAQARAVPVPDSDGTPAGDLLGLMLLLPSVELSADNYRGRGFDEGLIRQTLGAYQKSVAITEDRTGRPGIDRTYYNWLCLYAKALIFHYGGFNFEIRKMNPGVLYLRNRADGSLQCLLCSGTVHSSGRILGSGGYEDEAGAWQVEFRETGDAFCGHPIGNHRVSRQMQTFPKDIWECVLRGSDNVIGFHIPRKTNLSAQSVERALEEGRKLAQKAYPEYDLKAFHCHSWLLDPALEEILGDSSNIASFGKRFTRYPVKSSGQEVFGFIIPGKLESYEQIPEDTRLLRELKKRYLNGGQISAYAGVIF